MNREQAINYLISSGFTHEQVGEVVRALTYEPTTKNDLGVDCISRADAIKAMQNKAKKLKNEDTINGLCGAVAILYEMPSVIPYMPSVTPQEPSDCEACIPLDVQQASENGYAKGFNDAMRKISLSGNLEKQYQRGYADGMKAQEPRKGHWILDETDNSITCDRCGCLIWANDISNGEAYYCPNCGAKMESEE